MLPAQLTLNSLRFFLVSYYSTYYYETCTTQFVAWFIVVKGKKNLRTDLNKAILETHEICIYWMEMYHPTFLVMA